MLGPSPSDPGRTLESIATDGSGHTSTSITLNGSPRFEGGPVTLYTGQDGNVYVGISAAFFTTVLTVYRITPGAVGTFLCSGTAQNGASGLLHDGSIVFGAFKPSFAPSLLGILPSGTCTTAVFPIGDPIGNASLVSGAADGFLYVYTPNAAGGTLTKYAY